MKIGVLLPVATFVLGAGLAWGLQSILNPPSERDALEQNIASLNKTVADQKTALADANQRVLKASQIQAEAEKEEKTPEPAVPVASQPNPEPSRRSDFDGNMRRALENHLANRVNTLNLVLNLTPDQIAKLEKAMDEASKAASTEGNPGRRFSNGTTALNKELDAILSPEQKQAYEAYKTRERNSQMELAANIETNQMQNMLNLSQQQSDALFTKLAEIQQNQGKNTGTPENSSNSRENIAKQKKAAMRQILSDAQYQVYEQYTERQGDWGRGNFGRGGNTSGAR